MTYILGNILTYVLGLITSVIYFIIRPKTSFWFAKLRMRIFKRNMPVTLDSLISFGFDEFPTEGLLVELNELLNSVAHISSDLHKSSQGDLLQMVIELPERNIKLDGSLSINEDTEEAYALKTNSEDTVVYSSMNEYIESLFTVRDMLSESLPRSKLSMHGFPRITIGLTLHGNQIKILQWMKYDYSLQGFIDIPKLDIQVYYDAGRASVSSVAFQPYIKEILRNLVVDSVYQ